MIVNTQRLFTRLLPIMRITAVCDVGSMDGTDALRFRDVLPGANVYAFEPHPGNFRLMSMNHLLRERSIQLEPLAVSNFDGEADFFIVGADPAGPDPRRGMSSLHRRCDSGWAPAAVARVRTTRLDSYFADKCPRGARLALWIDTEGKAYEVLEGSSVVIGDACLLHVEVETTACIGAEQRLYPDVAALLERLGFVELATDQPVTAAQFNALYLRRDCSAGLRLRVRAALLSARARHLAGTCLARLCPACLRRHQALRRRAVTTRSPGGGSSPSS